MLIPRLLDLLLKLLIVVYQILILYFELGDLIVASLLLNAHFFEFRLVLFDLGAQLGQVRVLLNLIDDSEQVHGLLKVVSRVDHERRVILEAISDIGSYLLQLVLKVFNNLNALLVLPHAMRAVAMPAFMRYVINILRLRLLASVLTKGSCHWSLAESSWCLTLGDFHFFLFNSEEAMCF